MPRPTFEISVRFRDDLSVSATLQPDETRAEAEDRAWAKFRRAFGGVPQHQGGWVYRRRGNETDNSAAFASGDITAEWRDGVA